MSPGSSESTWDQKKTRKALGPHTVTVLTFSNTVIRDTVSPTLKAPLLLLSRSLESVVPEPQGLTQHEQRESTEACECGWLSYCTCIPSVYV